MQKLSSEEIRSIERELKVELPRVYLFWLGREGYGKLSDRLEIYHPKEAIKWLPRGSRYFAFGYRLKRREFIVLDCEKELVASIPEEKINSDLTNFSWEHHTDWAEEAPEDFWHIVIESRRKNEDTLLKKYGDDAVIIDFTSHSDEGWARKFSPYYPHGGIPVPFSPGVTGETVEGIWQGLKVFESEDVDLSKLSITSMKGLKRTVRRFGSVRGHRAGIHGKDLLSYFEARMQIYLPCYLWVLQNRLERELDELISVCNESNTVVLLDYETNTDVSNLSKPLSHAGLARSYIMNEWPH